MQKMKLNKQQLKDCSKIVDNLPNHESENRFGTITLMNKNYYLIPEEFISLFEKTIITTYLKGYKYGLRRKNRG